MKKSQRRERIYQTNQLNVYRTREGSFAIDGVAYGRRYRKRYKSLDEAIAAAHLIEEQKPSLNVCRTVLSQERIADAESACALLPGCVTLLELAQAYQKSQQSRQISLQEAIYAYLGTKDGCSHHTYRQVKRILFELLSFCGNQNLALIKKEKAECFLCRQSPGSFNAYLRICKGLFIWALRNEFITSNPFNHLRTKKREISEIAVLSIGEVQALLRAARSYKGGLLLPYVAICIYAGLRPDSEMRHLTWDKINLKDGEIRVIKGKTDTPRLVELPEYLISLLQQCDPSQPIYPSNFRRIWGDIRRMAGFRSGLAGKARSEKHLKPWIKDIMRHTAISYRVRATGDIFTTATWAGNSPEIIKRHYLGLITQAESKKFFDYLCQGF